MIPFPSVRDVFALLAATPDADLRPTCHRGAMWARESARLADNIRDGGRWYCIEDMFIAAMASHEEGGE